MGRSPHSFLPTPHTSLELRALVSGSLLLLTGSPPLSFCIGAASLLVGSGCPRQSQLHPALLIHFYFAELGMGPRASHVPSNCFASKSQSYFPPARSGTTPLFKSRVAVPPLRSPPCLLPSHFTCFLLSAVPFQTAVP